MSTPKMALAVMFLALLLAGCGSAQVPPQSSETPAPSTATPSPTLSASAVEVADSGPEESASIDLELTETQVFPEFGYSIDYPTGWFADTQNTSTIITQFEDDRERILSGDSSPLGYFLTMDHTDMERLHRLGLPRNPKLGDLLQFNMMFLGMPQPKSVSQTRVFGMPALQAKAGSEDRWALTHIGIRDDRFFLLVIAAPSEAALDQFQPTITKMLESIEPVAMPTRPTPETTSTGELVWLFETEASGVDAGSPTSAVIADGVVYFGAYDGNFYAVDLASGREKWRFETGDEIRTFPAVAGGLVYFGSFDNKLYAVDVESGQETWHFETGDNVNSALTVVDGVVYLGSSDHNLYALDGQTGQEMWRFETGDELYSAPAVADGVAYFGSLDDYLYAIDINTGQEKWKYQIEPVTGFGGVGSSPVIADGVVYFGSDDGYLNAVDSRTGQELWRFETGAGTPSSPAVADGIIYIGSLDGNLYAVDLSSGQELWRFETGDMVLSSPFVAEGAVYFGSWDNILHALDSQTGEALWRFETGDDINASPVVADGIVYFLGSDGVFYAVQAPQ